VVRHERNTWGIPQFVLAVILGAGVLWVWFEAAIPAEDLIHRRVYLLVGFVAALLAAWLGHASYPRVYNFKIYALSMGVAAVAFITALLIFVGPIGARVAAGEHYLATILLSYLSLLFVFVVTVIAPEYLGYRFIRRLTVVMIGIIVSWYVIGLGVPIVRHFLSLQLQNVQDVRSTAFWGLSSAAAAVLFLSLFTEAHSFGIGGIHAGGVLLLSVGWLTPESTLVLHAMVVGALPVMVALGTLIHWFQRLENRASYDPLLRIYNRDWCDRVFGDQSRLDTRPPFAIALVDLDHFKSVNDTYGHDAGDTVLRDAAQRIRSAVLPHGTVGRYGGEELLIFLPHHDTKRARTLLEAAREALEEQPISHGNTKIPVTASIGFAVRTEQQQPLSLIREAADRALYAAKDGGRNQVRLGRLRRKSEPAGSDGDE
jgi:diguanylate cyclase (GGDEF)-like protein